MSDAGVAERSGNHSVEISIIQIVGASEGTVDDNVNPTVSSGKFWTPQKIVYSIVLFIVSGIAEIGGGWLVFQAVRSGKPFWWGIVGSVILIIYGFIPTLQPISNFGRVFAVYGG